MCPHLSISLTEVTILTIVFKGWLLYCILQDLWAGTCCVCDTCVCKVHGKVAHSQRLIILEEHPSIENSPCKSVVFQHPFCRSCLFPLATLRYFQLSQADLPLPSSCYSPLLSNLLTQNNLFLLDVVFCLPDFLCTKCFYSKLIEFFKQQSISPGSCKLLCFTSLGC